MGQCSSPAARADHPRSRGVYATLPGFCVGCLGSSPLARGLRLDPIPDRDDARIIPARAGFTTSTPPTTAMSRDHPRSRGVYVFLRAKQYCERGSSPLARGLRLPYLSQFSRVGIIPARAGFTTVRSAMMAAMTGSSPLARGLRLLELQGDRRVGIIPARAGFTDSPADALQGLADHPRSRGVYTLEISMTDIDAGSSPLARGLHSDEEKK